VNVFSSSLVISSGMKSVGFSVTRVSADFLVSR